MPVFMRQRRENEGGVQKRKGEIPFVLPGVNKQLAQNRDSTRLEDAKSRIVLL